MTDLIENLFLLYSRRIICAENESLQDYKAPVSISPMLQRLSLSSVLWTTASRDHFRINREQYKKKTPESGWKRAQSLWFSKVKYRKAQGGQTNRLIERRKQCGLVSGIDLEAFMTGEYGQQCELFLCIQTQYQWISLSFFPSLSLSLSLYSLYCHVLLLVRYPS